MAGSGPELGDEVVGGTPGQLRPTSCRAIDSLAPLLDTPVEVLVLDRTVVTDGDLAVLERIPTLREVDFDDHRSYNRRLSDFAGLPG